MGDVESTHFQCEKCGKRFRWTAAVAGKKVRCPCGHIFQSPLNISQLNISLGQESYDLVEDSSSIKSAPPTAAAATPVLSYRTPNKSAPAAPEPEEIKNIYAPLWFLGGGAAIEILANLLELRMGLPLALLDVGIQLIFGTALMFVGMWIASKARQFQLGNMKTVPLRLAAISVAPSAAVAVVMPILKFIPFGGIGALVVRFVLYFALLGMFFDLDESDTWFCVWIIFLVNVGIYFVILAIH